MNILTETEASEQVNDRNILNSFGRSFNINSRSSHIIGKMHKRSSLYVNLIHGPKERIRKKSLSFCPFSLNGNWIHIPQDWLTKITIILNTVSKAIRSEDINLLYDLQKSQKSQYPTFIKLKNANLMSNMPTEAEISLNELSNFYNDARRFSSEYSMTNAEKKANSKFHETTHFQQETIQIVDFMNENNIKPLEDVIDLIKSIPLLQFNYSTEVENTNLKNESLSLEPLFDNTPKYQKDEKFMKLLKSNLVYCTVDATFDEDDKYVLKEKISDDSEFSDRSDFSEFNEKYCWYENMVNNLEMDITEFQFEKYQELLKTADAIILHKTRREVILKTVDFCIAAVQSLKLSVYLPYNYDIFFRRKKFKSELILEENKILDQLKVEEFNKRLRKNKQSLEWNHYISKKSSVGLRNLRDDIFLFNIEKVLTFNSKLSISHSDSADTHQQSRVIKNIYRKISKETKSSIDTENQFSNTQQANIKQNISTKRRDFSFGFNCRGMKRVFRESLIINRKFRHYFFRCFSPYAYITRKKLSKPGPRGPESMRYRRCNYKVDSVSEDIQDNEQSSDNTEPNLETIKTTENINDLSYIISKSNSFTSVVPFWENIFMHSMDGSFDKTQIKPGNSVSYIESEDNKNNIRDKIDKFLNHSDLQNSKPKNTTDYILNECIFEFSQFTKLEYLDLSKNFNFRSPKFKFFDFNSYVKSKSLDNCYLKETINEKKYDRSFQRDNIFLLNSYNISAVYCKYRDTLNLLISQISENIINYSINSSYQMLSDWNCLVMNEINTEYIALMMKIIADNIQAETQIVLKAEYHPFRNLDGMSIGYDINNSSSSRNNKLSKNTSLNNFKLFNSIEYYSSCSFCDKSESTPFYISKNTNEIKNQDKNFKVDTSLLSEIDDIFHK